MKRSLVVLLLFAALQPSAAHAAPADLACDEVTLELRGEATPVAPGVCPGVRPGALVRTDDVGGTRTGCTFNFVYDGYTVDGERAPTGRYIGTAGHCVLTEDGEHHWEPGTGPKAYDSTDRHIGHYVYAVNIEDDGVSRDFALIQLLADVDANPQMCHWGGPTGVNDDRATGLVQVRHFGQGNGFGPTIPARTAVTGSTMDPHEVHANGAIIFGDSGSGAISADGRALGVIVTVGLHTTGITSAEYLMGTGNIGITRVPSQVERAEGVLNLDLELVTAPLLLSP